jgi:DNA-directed RNA polymerase specialized sigma24 family protein
MGGGARPKSSFRISPVDRLGRNVSPLVIDAAEQIGRRAIQHAENLLIDPAVATTLIEEAAAAVSRAIDRKKHGDQQPIRDLRAYLFRAFLRRVNKAKKRQLMVADAVRLFSATSPNSTDPLAELELKILVDELLTAGDPVARDMFYRRAQNLSWGDIGSSYGISAHAAESRFSQAIRRLAKRLGLRPDS